MNGDATIDAQPLGADIELEEAAQGFSAVGSEPRLEVLLVLVRAGPDGLTVGDIQARVNMPASTLAHHLRFLAAGGLIEQERRGRAVVNRAAYSRIEMLATFLLQECCLDAATPGAHRHFAAHASASSAATRDDADD